MLEIELDLDPQILAVAIELIFEMTSSVGDSLAVIVEGVDEDPDLEEAWKAGLLEDLKNDMKGLFELLKADSLAQGKLVVSEMDAEAALRASSAVRLKVKSLFLSSICEEALENGTIDFDELEPSQQRGFACYLFLASLQGVILQALDPTLGDLMEF